MSPSFPKPAKRIVDRVARTRSRTAQAADFRKAVWTRATVDGLPRCEHCGRVVRHTMDLSVERGEVHHLHGRNVRPEDKYNPDAAVLLCAACHFNPAVVLQLRQEAG